MHSIELNRIESKRVYYIFFYSQFSYLHEKSSNTRIGESIGFLSYMSKHENESKANVPLLFVALFVVISICGLEKAPVGKFSNTMKIDIWRAKMSTREPDERVGLKKMYNDACQSCAVRVLF